MAVHSSTDIISRKTVVKDVMNKRLYADDLVIVANGKQSYRRYWRSGTVFYQTLNLDKTEVLHIGHQREELDIDLVGKKLTQGDTFLYLGGAVCGDGKTKRAIRR